MLHQAVKPESCASSLEMQGPPPAVEGLREERKTERNALLEFFALTFLITWGMIFLFFRFPFPFLLRFGEPDVSKPFYRVYWHICVYAPAISAFFVIARRHGFAAVRAYARRVLHWRVGIKWYLLVLVGFPAFYAADRIVFAAVGGNAPAYPFDPWYAVIPAMLLSIVANPAPVEELGWRGFALPLLQRRFSALNASMVLGLIWGAWHLPVFFVYGAPYTPATIPLYAVQAISLSIIMTALYNATGGNILLAFLFHWQIHDPLNIDAFPHDVPIVTFMMAAIAIGLTIALGHQNLGHKKHTELLS
ncbi:MAG: CPBP family intramembrane metalloprotease [Candidatus Abyssobacteria bacterium SURF_17]|uniref:CPBP family intramembrane metalloprotease n=1 Tax=Candidatus Abyssobacteria bacterium SURF_17 TaxID=2093361 RepID=A0A419EWK7_9BACT|nr:MAG: CPBP family intramembrane metalloprotease [Candidatus Abyssubacteria bacterium SURF_17]